MKIVTREQWGSRTDTGPYTPVTWERRAVVHHTADFSGQEFAVKAKPGPRWWLAKYRNNKQVQATLTAYKRNLSNVHALETKNMQFMQNYHMNTNGWSDLGYHYVIYPSGTIYEGRPRNTRGAHSNNAGNGMPGISFAMNSEVEVATPAALFAFEELCEHLGMTSYIGHRWVPGNATACPGKNLIRQLNINTATGIGRV